MECGSKRVSANVCIEPTCELAANSSQNSMPDGSFMEDKKKALRGGQLVVYLDAIPTQKETKNSLFTSFLGMYL